LQTGSNRVILPFLPGETHPEHALTRSIARLANINKTPIGLLQGHGEATSYELQSLMDELRAFYRVLPISADAESDWMDYEAILLLRPTDSIPPAHLERLQAYLENGGGLLIAYDRVAGRMENKYAQSQHDGLTSWLEGLGIKVEDKLIVSPDCGTLMMRQAGSHYNTPTPFPFAPVMSHFAPHPVTDGLELMLMQIASPVSYQGKGPLRASCLVSAGAKAARMDVPLRLLPSKASYGQKGGACAALAVEGRLDGGKELRVIVAGDGDFVLTNLQQRGSKPLQDNVWFLANAVDWLCGNESMAGLRTRTITSRPLTELTPQQRRFIKWANFGIPLFFLLITACILYVFKLTKRKIIYKKYHAKKE
jgi:hypothetical protein